MIKDDNKAGIALVSIVMSYWGITTVLMKYALAYMSSVTYIMLRFTVAAVLVLILFGKRLCREGYPRLFLHGAILGVLQIIPMECSTIAMYFTSASNSVFISQLSFVFVPLIECVIQRRPPDKRLLKTVVFLLGGLVIFSNVLFTGLNIGDIISAVSAVFNSFALMGLKKFAEEDDSKLLGGLQIVFASVISIAIWIFIPGSMEICTDSLMILFLTGVIGTALAFVLLAMGQAKTSSSNAAFLSLLQPVCGMIGACFIADRYGHTEEITWYKLIGAVIIIFSLIMYLKKEKPGRKKLRK